MRISAELNVKIQLRLLLRSAGAAIGFSDAFESFFNMLAAARPGGLLADIAGYF
jgi:hypothetical protein